MLYVGTAVDLRRRVGQYFNGADPRTRIKEMASLATAVDHVECAHDLEAGVRELRLLAAHAPPYNRRSKFPHRWWWLVLTDEAVPEVRSGASTAIRNSGPFRKIDAPSDRSGRAATPSRPPRCWRGSRACAPAPSGWAAPRCTCVPSANCRHVLRRTASRRSEYAVAPAASRRADRGRRQPRARRRACAHRRVWPSATATRRPPGCGTMRPRRSTCCGAGQRLRALAAVTELVAARPDGNGGWHLAVIRHGQLAAAGTARRGVPPMPVIDAICVGAQAVLPTDAPLGGALVEETGLIARWLAQPGVRIVRAEPGYASPVGSAGRWAGWAASARSARVAAEQIKRTTSQTFCVNRTQRASSCSAAPESIASTALARPDSQAGTHLASLASPAWATIAPAALSTTASRTGPLAPPSTERDRGGVGLGVAADELGYVGPLEPERRRVEGQPLDGPGLHPPDRARRGGGQLVEAVVAVHHQHAGAASGEHPCHHLGQFAPRATDQAGPRRGRIRQRPKQIEDRRHPDLAAHHPGVPVRRVELRRECEADPDLGHAAGDIVGPEIDAHPQRLERVGTAGQRRRRAIAVLDHRHPGRGHDDRRHRRQVHRVGPVATGADHVDGVVADHVGRAPGARA